MTKKLRLWLAALVMGAGLAGPVHATVYNIGDLSALPIYVNTSPLFANGTSFSDTYNFMIPSIGSFSSIASSLEFGVLHISNFRLSLAGPSLNATFLPDAAQFIKTGILFLAGGNYSATVTGLASGAAGGLYNIQMAAAVPEPSEWMMMLAGLILVGFMVKRRSDLI
jgi:hypothetical protein